MNTHHLDLLKYVMFKQYDEKKQFNAYQLHSCIHYTSIFTDQNMETGLQRRNEIPVDISEKHY